MVRALSLLVAVAALVVGPGLVREAAACPFCSAVSQTFTEEINTMDVVVIAKLAEIPPVNQKAGDEIANAKFQVAEVIKGGDLIKVGDKIETLFFGEGKVGQQFLVMGIDPPKLMWSTPLPLSNRAREYLANVLKLPKEGVERLVFFQEYLEDSDDMLARDAYDEFAKTPYETVKALKPHMKHDQIVGWIKNPEVPASRRRLYLVMLGVCGSEKDLPMLEGFMRSSDRKDKSGLDSLVACYLTLQGESGLALVEELFLKNKKSDYADTYAAIMAVRFHGTEGGVIERDRLVESLRYMLDRPELADLVIPDLARWEDWESMDQLFELFKKSDDKTSWVRVPVVNYLRACPLPKAKELLAECEKIDPAAVKRANTFFPGTTPTPAPDANKATRRAKQRAKVVEKEVAFASALSGSTEGEVALVSAEVPVEERRMASASQVSSPTEAVEIAAVNPGVAPAAALLKSEQKSANLWLVLGVPWGMGLALLVLQWNLLRGTRRA